jgi:hypothetical protein
MSKKNYLENHASIYYLDTYANIEGSIGLFVAESVFGSRAPMIPSLFKKIKIILLSFKELQK